MTPRSFLADLEDAIEAELPPRREVTERVEALKEDDDDATGYAYWRENGFLGEYVVPPLHDYLTEHLGSSDEARRALRFESYRSFEKVSDTPVRSTPVPFSKSLGDDISDHLHRWLPDGYKDTKEKSMPGKQAPDMGITDPAPHSTVIEAKYFRGDTLDEAQKALANSIYEAFYYRALPNLEADDDAGPWSFDYGCLIAYDTTKRGLLHEAWSRLASDVRESFWTGAGVKVILLGGGE